MVWVSDLGRTFWLELREPSVILRAKTKNVTLPKSLDLRVVVMKATVGTSPLTYTSLSFDSNSNGEDPAPTTSKLFNIIMYGGAGFGCLMCMAVLMRYCTRSTELEKLEGDETDPILLAPNRLGIKESVVSMGMDNTTSDNNSRL